MLELKELLVALVVLEEQDLLVLKVYKELQV